MAAAGPGTTFINSLQAKHDVLNALKAKLTAEYLKTATIDALRADQDIVNKTDGEFDDL